MKSIVFIDTVYPPVLNQISGSSYKERRDKILGLCFGTSNYYSEAFRSYGWSAEDIIANDEQGLKLWCLENFKSYKGLQETVIDKLFELKPDVLYCQDLSFFSPDQLNWLRQACRIISGQISCAWPGDAQINSYDILFSSFPHYGPRIAKFKPESIFLQIGFGGSPLLEKLVKSNPSALAGHPKELPLTFVGGLGWQWVNGVKTLTAVAQAIPEFKWWGYGEGNAPDVLRQRYQGSAWGLPMYDIYSRSLMVVNRHGEVAEGYSNNMRMFEATGCGAMLLTEESKNIRDYFVPGKECVTYTSDEDLIYKINYYLSNPLDAMEIAARGQDRTLRDHCYDVILEKVSKKFLQKLSD